MVLRAFVLLLALLALLLPAHAQKRVALVIGNSAYASAGTLSNPTRDSTAVETLLRAAGFDTVEARRDLGALAMRRALRYFSFQVRDADIAVIFYAGHGIEVNGTNYLIPVDAALERDIDVEDETVPLDRLTQVLEPAKRLRLVILDACRDNPFARSMKRTIGNRSIGRGLARVDVLTSDTLIAFAAKAGSTASDGDGANSPYTTALVKHLTTPGLDLRLAFGRVRDDVLKVTANRQEPFVYGSLGGSEIALVAAVKPVPPPVALAVSPPAPLPQVSEAERAWAAAQNTKSVTALEAFIARFKDSFYADLARARIEELKSQQTAAIPPPASAPAQPVAPDPSVLTRALQAELKRVGCDPGPVSGGWSGKTRQALGEFIRLTKAAIPSEEPTDAALDAVKKQKERVCPLHCGTAEIEKEGRCVAKASATAPKTKAPPGANSNEAAKKGPQGVGMCWGNNGGQKGFNVVPCNDPTSSGQKIN